VSGILLDVNVLVALLWPAHESYGRAQRWFSQNAHQGWVTCPMTQAGFVRIASNPAFSRHAVSPSDALEVLSASLRHPAHRFWTDDINITDALAGFGRRLLGHRQITDGYLLALASHKKGRLVTFDKSLASLLPDKITSGTVLVLH
jgi:hypothetical protein